MALNIAVSITHGLPVFGELFADEGDVLYLALEDTLRRLKSRYTQMAGKDPDTKHSSRLSLQLISPSLARGALDDIGGWVDSAEHPRLVVVDTLGKVRPERNSQDMYQESYSDVSALKRLADEKGIGLLVIHHTRKASAEDALEEVLGSTGFTGAADSIFVLKRRRGENDAVLMVTGRDVEESSMFLTFDPERGMWLYQEKAGTSTMADSRDNVYDWAMTTENKDFTPANVAAGVGISKDAARMACNRLVRTGRLVRVRTGWFRVPTFIEEAEDPTMFPEGDA